MRATKTCCNQSPQKKQSLFLVLEAGQFFFVYIWRFVKNLIMCHLETAKITKRKAFQLLATP